jgi:3-hydroxyacyl-[acyl-carrier-protein] dehydratase
MSTDEALASLNADAIQKLIPHREPFLFIQSADVLNEAIIQGIAFWPASNPIMQGHFPNQPVVPGVCQIEACGQLAGVLIAWNECEKLEHQDKKLLGVLGAIRQAKFQTLLRPDRELNIRCQLRTMSPALYLVSASGRVGDVEVMSCEFVIGLRPTTPLNSKQSAD